MPRGPGKKENYNLDYSRFSEFDHLDEQAEKPQPKDEADAAGGFMPDQMQEMLRGMPPELQEAYRMMAISKQTGDSKAQERASELALRAIQNGTPEIRENFLKNMQEQMPDAVPTLMEELDSKKDPADVLSKLQNEAVKRKVQEAEAEETGVQINELRKQMEEGQKATRQELENLQKQQDALEKINSPEEFFKFMTESGLGQEDFQRIFSGDEQHMQARFNECIDKQISGGVEKKVAQKSADALKAAEEIHRNLCGGLDGPDGTEEAAAEEEAKKKEEDEMKKKKRKEPKKPAEPEVTIPMYRLQYAKDESGRYTSVELKCNLPGVADMSAINLDVSDKHLRLSTCAPAPRYAVNAGPFPVLIDADAARAKYSKKREELSISVPAKVVE